MTDFPDGPGVDLSGVFTPDSRCGQLRRELWRMIKPAIDAGMTSIEDHPAVRGHLAQLRFAEDRLSAALTAKTQVSSSNGNAEFRSDGDMSRSGRKPGLSTAEAAGALGITTRSVLNLIYKDSLQGVKSGRRWVVDSGSVAALCEERRDENESKAA